MRVRTFQGLGRESVILAAGPILGAAVGAITNLITSTWNWWLFSLLLVLVSLAAGAAVFASSRHQASPAATTEPSEAPESVCTLPPNSPVFVGRESELTKFDEDVTPTAGRAVVYMITGSPGIGKTELAIQAANRMKSRYPGGQIFLGFRSHAGEASRMDVSDLLIDALDAVSKDSAHNSLNAAKLSPQWRVVTNGRKLLIVLDDVDDISQIESLMPNSPGCAVIITSRQEVAGVYPDIFIRLGVLSLGESEEMISKLIERTSLSVSRDAIRSLARVHHLPLTLQHVANQLVIASDRSFQMSQSTPGNPGDPLQVIRETVSTLTETEKLVFRRAALYPGPHVTAAIAGAMTGLVPADAESVLTALHQRKLIIRPDPLGYTFHDLVRSLALDESRTQDTDADRTAARERLFEATVDTLGQLNVLISAPRVTRAVSRSASLTLEPHDEFEALEWFGNYFEDFRSITRLAINQEWPDTWRLTDGLAYFMRIHRNIPQAIDLTESALQIAIRGDEEVGQAVSYFHIAVLQRALSNYDAAEDSVNLALAIFADRNDLLGQARCYSELGTIMHHRTRYPESLENTQRALDLFTQLDDKSGIANSRGALGMVSRLVGDYQSARLHLNRALDLYREIGNPRNQAWILIELGTVDRQTGNYERARDQFIEARELFDRADDDNGRAWAGRELGIVSRMTGDYPAATDQLSGALATFNEIGSSKRNIADAHIELGALYRLTGALPEAREQAHEALRIYQKIGNIRGAAWAELECGAIERLQGAPAPRAAEYFTNALEVYQQIHDRSGLARAYQELGMLAADSNDSTTAREQLTLALNLYNEMRSPESSVIADKLAALGS